MASPHAGPTGDQPSSFQEVIAPYVKAHTHELSTHRPVYDDAGHSAAAAQARAHEHGLEHTPEPEPKHMPEGYSYMCPGLFAPARVDDPAVKLRDTGAKVYYLTRRPEAISPAQDAQLRSTDGLFCRFFNEEEEDYDPSSKEALDEPAPLAFFPWQHAEDGILDDAIVIARQSLETGPRCCGDVRATPVFFLDAQSPLDNTVLAMELSTPYDNDVPGLVLAYGRLSVRQMSIFLCLIEVKGLGLDEYLFTSGHLQYWRG